MDPLTTLLAAAAATGPNTLQSQALTALRSAGPQESFFTRMGNPRPLQVQQLAQPTTPQLNPIIAQQASAPTAIQQHFPMPIMPLASPMADPAPTALHIPTLQAIHRMQQQNSPAPAVMPMLPQTPVMQPQATLPRDPTEYTQANFPSLTSRQLAVLAQLEMQDKQALRNSARNILQPGLQTVASGSAQSTGLGHTQPTSITSRPLEAAQRSKWSYRAPPTQYTGPREGFSQPSQPQMEARMPSVQYMDLTEEAETAQQQPPSRFRPSNYTVDLSNTTNPPPPPQMMVKPAVMLRRDERPSQFQSQ